MVRNTLNRLLEAQLGRSVAWPDVERLESCRRNLLRRYGPDSLSAIADRGFGG